MCSVVKVLPEYILSGLSCFGFSSQNGGEVVSLLLSISSEAPSPGQLHLLQQPACKVKHPLTIIVLPKRKHSVSPSIPKSSYKVREQSLLQSTSHHRKRSTQSDTALLPTNVYFQRTLSPLSQPSKVGSRTSRCRGSRVRLSLLTICTF